MQRRPDLAQFFEILASASRRCLMLDYDGTLAPFTPQRNSASPYPGVRERLGLIVRDRLTRIVVISGRAATDLPPLLDIDPLPEIWGCHGLERLNPDGAYYPPVLRREVVAALETARKEAVQLDLGGCLEVKPGSLALHWRGLGKDDALAARSAVEPAWSRIANQPEFVLTAFDGGIELRTSLATKADAVRAVLSAEPLQACCAYLGDDLTDEDAFAAIAGRGLGVLVRPKHRDTLAAAWLIPPEELIEFFDMWIFAGKGKLA